MSPSLEAIVKHDGRLDLLCCLVDGEPLTAPQLSVRTGKLQKIVGYYEATLDGHPDWVREAIDKHRR